MKRALLFAAALALASPAAVAQDAKIGALMDITGPIASFIPPLQNAVALAIKHVNDQGGLLKGKAALAVGDTQGAAQTAVDAACARILAACKAKKRCCGVFTPSLAAARARRAQGSRLVVTANDIALAAQGFADATNGFSASA